jgi:hypothetical protein
MKSSHVNIEDLYVSSSVISDGIAYVAPLLRLELFNFGHLVLSRMVIDPVVSDVSRIDVKPQRWIPGETA